MKEKYDWERKPLAAKGLISYRYPGTFSYGMIGAKDDNDALREAKRMGFCDIPTMDKLEIWDSNISKYVLVSEYRKNK